MDVPPSLIEYGGAAVVLVVMASLLRWTFGTQNSRRPPVNDPADPVNDGLLEEVSRVPTEPAAQVLRRRLAEQGIRSTVSRAGDDGYRLLVFRDEVKDARVVLSRGALE
ncbi:hypothetical protein [Pseudonocardia sp. KRD291]|uniref:hypothetical protein n=1 Tax=Pseudonocardia sp. KRD291 TaxID=2792007 RepID=UPI001C4A6A80|nr:hypothetical protein [Pseudonocardia sp. KRD291]MBW0105883.1 hypothetical protein [Pseudonocardia sp. KRD291]